MLISFLLIVFTPFTDAERNNEPLLVRHLLRFSIIVRQ